MKDFISIIQTEYLKIWKKKSNVILTILVVLLCIGFGIINHQNASSQKTWRANAQKDLETYTKEYEELLSDKDQNSKAIVDIVSPIYEKAIATTCYALEHNIPYNVNNALQNIYKSTSLLNVVTIILILIAITNFTNEYQFGTIKQLLTTSISRRKWLLSKCMTYVTLTAIFFLLQLISCFFVGFILDGIGSSITLEYKNGTVIEVSIITSLIHQYIMHFIFATVLLFVATYICALTKTTLPAIVATLGIWFGNTVLGNFLGDYKWYKYTPFPHIGLSNYMENGMIKSFDKPMTQSLTIVMIYFISLTLISFYAFQKRDV